MLFPNACIFPTRDEAAKRSNIDPQHAIQHDVGWNCLIVYPFVLLITWIFDQAHRQIMSLGTGASKGWWGPRANTRHSKEVSWQPCRREAALQAATNQHRHWASVEKLTCPDPYHEPLPIRRGRAERWIGKIGQPKQWSTKLNWASKLPIWWPKQWSVQGGELWRLEHTCKHVARKALVANPHHRDRWT